jgi:hypothetical protein
VLIRGLEQVLTGRPASTLRSNDGTDHINILKSTTSPISEDPFGQVSGGRIQLSGYLNFINRIVMSESSSDNEFVMTINGHNISTLCRPDIIADDQPNGKLYCLPIRTYRMTTGTVATQRLGCLILKPTGNIRGEYRRWAQATLENDLDQKAIHRETRVTITII